MTPRTPAWLNHADETTQTILSACYLDYVGYNDEAAVLTQPLFGRHTPHDELEQIVELIGAHEHCFDDAQNYAYISEGLLSPGIGSTWLEWSERQCEQILADLTMLAEKITLSVRPDVLAVVPS